MSSRLRERWLRLRNYQSRDFWAMVFARPLTILFLLGIADCRWVTPNRITVASLLAKLGGVATLALAPSYAGAVWAAVLVNLGLVLDNMDGTLARYRRSGTLFGAYLDKATDAVTLLLVFWATGYRAYLESGVVWDLVLPALGVGGAMVAGYAMWVASSIRTDLELGRLLARGELEPWVRKRLTPDGGTLPPQRTFRDWIVWLGRALGSIVLFNEVDIFFFLALGLISGQLWIFTRVLCPLYALAFIIGPVVFAFKIRRAERCQ